jgi:hypothetical protein
MNIPWRKAGLLAAVLVLGYMPWLYGTMIFRWFPENIWVSLLFGPVAVIARAALAGGAAARFSKWWLLTLVVPLAGMILLLTEHV